MITHWSDCKIVPSEVDSLKDTGKQESKRRKIADGKELRKEWIKGGGVKGLERVPAFL